jgi:hypothetical protein
VASGIDTTRFFVHRLAPSGKWLGLLNYSVRSFTNPFRKREIGELAKWGRAPPQREKRLMTKDGGGQAEFEKTSVIRDRSSL